MKPTLLEYLRIRRVELKRRWKATRCDTVKTLVMGRIAEIEELRAALGKMKEGK